MPDQKISADPVLAAPSATAALSGIDPGTDATKNYRFQVPGLKAWLAYVAADISDFVATAIAAARGALLQREDVSATTYSVVSADHGKDKFFTAATAVTVTLPSNTTTAIPVGAVLGWKAWGAGTVTFAAGSSATVRSRGGVLASAGQYASGTVEKVATNEWLVSGDLS